MVFIPERVFIRERALDYPLGRRLKERFIKEGFPVIVLKPRQRIATRLSPGARQGYIAAKKTLVVTVAGTDSFLSSKPSADYQLPLASGCTGFCEYCYLQTTLGKHPYVQVYVNVGEVLARAGRYMAESDSVVTFEGSCTSDPLPTEPYTGALRRSILFFAAQPRGRFRFVTKYTEVEPLLSLQHNGHTRFRFSINSERVIKNYEHATPPLGERLKATLKVLDAGYPSGFIVAPIILDGDWRADYRDLFEQVRRTCGDLKGKDVTFELITHRYTERAKSTILEVFPKTTLPMDPADRQYKRGQFGYGKYVYPRELMQETREFFTQTLNKMFPGTQVQYFV
ncbi:MAG: spore photoproduct lyase [Bacillota bacterium]|uniref:spore photoproduct lyase n=1 Tax=Desulforudis sp. DRI-14 TaxID=3459793 RepID=UPI0034965858